MLTKINNNLGYDVDFPLGEGGGVPIKIKDFLKKPIVLHFCNCTNKMLSHILLYIVGISLKMHKASPKMIRSYIIHIFIHGS